MRLTHVGRYAALALFAMFVLLVLPAGCGRSSLEPELLAPEAGTPGSCGPQTCPGGCCDANGVCHVGTDRRACGRNAVRCNDCVALGFDSCGSSRVCGRTVSQCDDKECPTGCCTTEGAALRCVAGRDPTACGRSGMACVDCSADGRTCEPVTATCSAGKCDATNCQGCCVGDLCLSGQDFTACGTGGVACQTCAAGQLCATRPTGGGLCQGTPSCGPLNCNGCCTPDGVCVEGIDSLACGTGGQACQACGAGQFCAGDKTCRPIPACGPQSCAGCCATVQGQAECVIATTAEACGKGGEACASCGPGFGCNAGVCERAETCGPATCTGCCVGDICATGNQSAACGGGGVACSNCGAEAPPRVCQGGVCELPTCGPNNCLGCCAGNTCVVGTQDNACGSPSGLACTDCTQAAQVCVGRTCRERCGAGNCAGCCQGNTCSTGFANSACGSGGVSCVNCSARGSTCNGLTAPRLCSDVAGTCPASYAACSAGITTPVTPSLAAVCSEDDLDAVRTACASGPDAPTCVAAMQVLGATNAVCQSCLAPFNQPFALRAGLYRCAAPFVSAACNRSTGCTIDCAQASCAQCPDGSRAQCVDLAFGGQCASYFGETTCTNAALATGQLCSAATYADFGLWLRAVGDHFCGNGP